MPVEDDLLVRGTRGCEDWAAVGCVEVPVDRSYEYRYWKTVRRAVVILVEEPSSGTQLRQTMQSL